MTGTLVVDTEIRFAEEKSMDAKEKSPLAIPPRMCATVLPMHADVSFMDAKESCMHTRFHGQLTSNVRMVAANRMQHEEDVRMHAKELRLDTKDGRMDAKESCMHASFLGQLTSNVRMDTANGMHHGKSARMHAKECRMDTKDGRMHEKDGRMHTKEFPVHAGRLRIHGKSPGIHASFLRMDGKLLMKDAHDLLQDDPAAPTLRRTRFIHAFFSCILSGEESKYAFSFRMVDPPTILHTSSAIVLKQRSSVHYPVPAIDNDNTAQRTEMVGREDIAHIDQQSSMRPFYESTVSRDETVRQHGSRERTSTTDILDQNTVAFPIPSC